MSKPLSLDLRERVVRAYRGGGRTQQEVANLSVLEGLLADKSDATNVELAARMAERTGLAVSPATLSRAIAVLGWTRKKSASSPASATPRVSAIFIESGSTISMTRTHARAPRGARTSEAVPRNRGSVTTILGALTTNGLEATMTIEGGNRRRRLLCLPR